LEVRDSELVLRAGRGDSIALHAIVNNHSAALHALAYSLVGQPADVEDLVQETFLAAFQGLTGFRGQSQLRTWLIAILLRQVAAWRRKGRIRETLPLAESLINTAGPNTSTADAKMDVAAALQKISSQHRDALVLREFGGLSYQEIADVLGIPRGTVESRLHRARLELRELLTGYGSQGADNEKRMP